MTRKIAAAAAVMIVAVAGCAAATAAAATAAKPKHCVTFDVTGNPPMGVGHPWDELVQFCGRGLPDGQWMCIAPTPLIGPGTRLTGCAREP